MKSAHTTNIFYFVIPIYNVERYIRQCLDSLVAQSYGRFCAILVNDGSSDKSGEIAQIYAKNDKRFIYLSQRNDGVSTARNKALDYIFNNLIGGGGI
ncbi:glycosyltransferase family 2 protein [Helicobacter sp. 23-1044]